MAMSVKPGKNAPVGLIRYFKISIVPAKTLPTTGPNSMWTISLGIPEKPIRRVLPSSMLNEPRTMATAPSMAHTVTVFTCFNCLKEPVNKVANLSIKKLPPLQIPHTTIGDNQDFL